MLAGPAFLAETLVLVDVIDARAVHARVRLALVDLCSSKCNTCNASCDTSRYPDRFNVNVTALSSRGIACFVCDGLAVTVIFIKDKSVEPISQFRPV